MSIRQDTDGSLLSAVKAAPRALVFLTVPWSGPERSGRAAFRAAAARLAAESPALGVECFTLDEQAEWCQAWLAGFGLPQLGTGSPPGAGSMVWLESGRVVSLEVAGCFVEPDGIVARSHLLWAPQVEPSRPMPPLAPEPILRAALYVVHVAAYTTRNWTYADGWPRQQVYDLWEALHVVPDLVTRWRPDAEQELLRYLEEYDRKWPSPRLREMYQRHIDLGGRECPRV